MLHRPQQQLRHRSYHEIIAATHADLGGQLGELFGSISRSYIEEARASSHWIRTVAAARPLFDVTEQFFPNLTAELKAYASAAKVSMAELWALSCEAEADEEASAHEMCTTVVTDSGMLIAHNEDWDETAETSVCVVKKTLPNVTLLGLHYYDAPLGGNAICMNSHGYVQAINSLSHSDRRIGVPKNVVARWLSETSDAKKDFASLAKLPRASGFNHVLVDGKGGVFDIECSASRQCLIRPRLPFVHTNHYLSPEFAACEEAEAGDSTFSRYDRACRRVRPQMTVDQIMKLTADKHEPGELGILNPNTIGRVIVDLERRLAKIWLKREKKAGWIDYPLV